jgi:hypothetical protein
MFPELQSRQAAKVSVERSFPLGEAPLLGQLDWVVGTDGGGGTGEGTEPLEDGERGAYITPSHCLLNGLQGSVHEVGKARLYLAPEIALRGIVGCLEGPVFAKPAVHGRSVHPDDLGRLRHGLAHDELIQYDELLRRQPTGRIAGCGTLRRSVVGRRV